MIYLKEKGRRSFAEKIIFAVNAGKWKDKPMLEIQWLGKRLYQGVIYPWPLFITQKKINILFGFSRLANARKFNPKFATFFFFFVGNHLRQRDSFTPMIH